MENKITLIGHPIVTFMSKNTMTGIVRIARTSGYEDVVKFECENDTIVNRIIRFRNLQELTGEIRTRNTADDEGKYHKSTFVNVTNTKPIQQGGYDENDRNSFEIDCILVKKDALRTTPKGRVIIEAIVAINNDNKSQYPSIIAWGRNAQVLNVLAIGTRLHLKGRFQSRNYKKQIGEDVIEKTAYELSVSELIMK